MEQGRTLYLEGCASCHGLGAQGSSTAPSLIRSIVVLTDRYIYSLIARAIVRGSDPEWLREVYGFALRPDAIFYLRLQIDDLVTRVLQSRGFDYWESGMDMHMGEDMYESFVRYQKWLLAEFDKMVETFGFQIVDASGSVEEVFENLRDRVDRVIARNGYGS